ncbi:Mor transcription activator family protein [Pseudomonas pseudonitroreducens]|uniref:Mor transcription activator family protein n=1 Tax=Pseudomonas pseudonitroreducens TaxID=2892326 RepID=UPI001F28E584|nr:Mor transcription activator family protein [Pseudomonas pseudonitroreducens]
MNDKLFEDDASQLDPDKVLDHMADPAVLKRWEGSLMEMVELAEHALREALGDQDNVPSLARQVVLRICETMGGEMIYVPRGERLRVAIRDAALFRDWRGGKTSIPELVRKYRLATPTVYDIIARQRALHRRSEPDLFGFGEEGSSI